MSTNAQLTADMKEAMKAKDKVALSTIRALKTAIKNAAIEQAGADAELDEAAVLGIIRKQIKQRQDSVEQFQSAGRAELAENEIAEIAVLQKYLPAAMSEEEIAKAVAEAIAEAGATSRAQMGQVMGILQKKTDGRADGKTLSQAVIKALS